MQSVGTYLVYVYLLIKTQSGTYLEYYFNIYVWYVTTFIMNQLYVYYVITERDTSAYMWN